MKSPYFILQTGILGTALFLFFGIIAGTVIGGVVSWVVSLVFPYVIDTINSVAKTQLTPFELGAVLGFIGGFFRSSSTNKN